MYKCGIKAPKTVEIWNFVNKIALTANHWHNYYEIFRFYVHLYSIGSIYVFNLVAFIGQTTEHLPSMGAFSHKFSTALAPKLLIRCEKVGGAKMEWTPSITIVIIVTRSSYSVQ